MLQFDIIPLIFVGLIFYKLLDIVINFLLKFYKSSENNKLLRYTYISLFATLYFSITGTINYKHFENCIDMNDQYDTRRLKISFALFISYILYDMIFNEIACIYYSHHFITSFPLILAIVIDHKETIYITISLFITEYSTVILNLIYLSTGKIKAFLEIIFAFIFFFVRPVYISYILIFLIKCIPNDPIDILSHIVLMIIVLILFVINIYWFICICFKIYKKIIKIK